VQGEVPTEERLREGEELTEWFARGRALLEQFEGQVRSHEELADGYRAQAGRLRALLGGGRAQIPSDG